MLVVFIFLFRIIADYTSRAQIVNIKPTSVTAFENDKVTFTCTAIVQDDWRSTRFGTSLDTQPIIDFVNNGGNCYMSFNRNSTLFDGRCGTSVGDYLFEIRRINDRFHNQSVQCIVRYGIGVESDTIIEEKSTISIMIPITSVSILPTGINHTATIETGLNLTFTCRTDYGRPAALVDWFIGGMNVTNQATSVSEPNETKFISTSTLIYKGNNADHNKIIYCEAGNIDEKEKVKSAEKVIFIILPPTMITIHPDGYNNVVIVVSGIDITFTCETDASRPASWIQWYIGGENVTTQSSLVITEDTTDNTQFISTSTLRYTGRDADHNKSIYCEAFNTEGGQKVKANDKTIHINVPVTSLTITPVDSDNRLNVVSGKQLSLVCKTNAIRPEAKIQWYIGGRNMTNQATISTVQDSTDDTKIISTSTLSYTGDDNDHAEVVYCEAVNIEEIEKAKSGNKTLFIILPVSAITIKPVGVNGVVSIALGDSITFTCNTTAGRPAASIQWYIGVNNITNNTTSMTSQVGTKYVSTSNLMYIGKNTDHNEPIYCTVNSLGGQKVTSNKKKMFIIIPVPKVTFAPNEVEVKVDQSQELTCRTNASRPAAWIQWFIGGENVTIQATSVTAPDKTDNTTFVSTSTLVYRGKDTDHNKLLYCEAVNTEHGQKVKTDKKTMYIVVSITEVIMTSDMTSNVVKVESHKTRRFTCITNAGRPAVLINWFVGKKNVVSQATSGNTPEGTKFISNSTLIYSGDDADHNKVIYCEVGNVTGGQDIRTDNRTLYIIVPIANVSMIPLGTNKVVTVKSGESKNFTCKTDSSRPAAWIQWYINEQNVTDQAITEIQHNGTQYISSSTLPYVGNIQDHYHIITCDANNVHGKYRNISVIGIFNIYSFPTTEGNQPPPEKVFIGSEEMLILTVTVIANPSPVVKWTFTNATSSGFDISQADFNITSADVFRHVISYEKENPTQTDFGNYTIEASNTIEPNFVHTFVVEPAQVPTKPSYLEAECEQFAPRINVSWKSNFDGGKPQRFTVYLTNTFTNRMIKSPYILDIGQNAIHFYTYKLEYATNYMFHIEARNIYGGVNSSELVNCTTTKRSQEQGSSSAIIGGAAGSSTALIAIIIIAVVLFLRRRSRNKGDDKKHLNRYNKNSTKQEENDEEELKDNPLYGTSSISMKVDKSQQGIIEPVTASNKKQKLNQTNDIYENSEDFRKGYDQNLNGNVNNRIVSPGISPSVRYKNKDGLVYAELEFAPSESGKKFFIIGSENRTNYAKIDLTLKADSLPDDSDEDVIKDSN